MGVEKKFFEGLEPNFVVMDDSSARHAAFQSRQIDIMISSADVFVQERAQGIKGSIFLVTDESYGADGIVTKQEIKAPSDLRGRKVAFARATPSHYLLYKVLNSVGLSAGDVEQVIVEDPGHAGQAFVGGSVDAAVTWEPLLTQVRTSGNGHVLMTTRDMPGTIVDVLVASPQLIKNIDVLSRFIRGWMKSVEYIKAHPQESKDILARGLGIPPEEAEGIMAGLQFAGPDRNRYFLCSGSEKLPRLRVLVEDASRFWQSQGIIQALPSLQGSISTSFCDAWDN